MVAKIESTKKKKKKSTFRTKRLNLVFYFHPAAVIRIKLQNLRQVYCCTQRTSGNHPPLHRDIFQPIFKPSGTFTEKVTINKLLSHLSCSDPNPYGPWQPSCWTSLARNLGKGAHFLLCLSGRSFLWASEVFHVLTEVNIVWGKSYRTAHKRMLFHFKTCL